MKKTELLATAQEIERNNIILKLAVFTAILVYTFWGFFDDPLASKIFYIGNALFIFLLALYIRQATKKSFLTFFLFCVTLNNLLDELLFDPQKIGLNEYLATVIIIIVYFIKDKDPKSDA
jgi:hypothetical protein